MVLEDLQWAPSITLAFLDAVVSSPTPLAGLLVVGTYRTEDVGAGHPLLALFERAVGLYAFLIGINAYHQPGVEAGKKAAQELIAFQGQLLTALRQAGRPLTPAEAATAAGAPQQAESAYHLLRHLAANSGRGIQQQTGATPAEDRFSAA